MSRKKMNRLFKPESYEIAPSGLRASVCNGCGTNGWKGKLVPETMYGLNISEACNIHDWMYSEGHQILHKDVADRAFLNNLVRIIDNQSRFWILKKLRLRRAKKYYQAVKYFGGPAFWEGKNWA